MRNERRSDQSLYVSLLRTLEEIGTPYMLVGAFAGIVYGLTRTTYDIDIVVDLSAGQIQALAEAFSAPRYYADATQMRDSVRMGIMFNIIDATRGEKADLIPLRDDARSRQAFDRRVRQVIDIPGEEIIDIWCAHPVDVIIGKLAAWAEGRSSKHEADIYQLMVLHYLEAEGAPLNMFDEAAVDAAVTSLGEDAVELWEAVKEAARHGADRLWRHSRPRSR